MPGQTRAEKNLKKVKCNRSVSATATDNNHRLGHHHHLTDTMNHSTKPENAATTLVAQTLADTLTSITQQPQRIPDPPLSTPPPKINPYDVLSVIAVVLAFATFVFLPLAVIAIVVIALKS